MSLLEILQLIGSLGFFIFGMKIMSEAIQKVAGSNLRKILGTMTQNRLLGVLTGFSVTSLIQSSSATTVMIVSFVNAGLLTLKQAIGVIMGANIGTTMTAVLLTVFGFSKLKIAAYALPVIAIGFPLLFAKKSQLKSFGEMLIGFALLFMGLDELKNSVPQLSAESLSFLTSINDYGIFSTLIFVLIGTLLTVIIQSSSAAMALTLVLCEKGIIQFDMAAAIVLGENIGTTITANLAALIGNVHAKRAARAHLVFNVIGVFWMLLVFNWFLMGIDSYMINSSGRSPFEDDSSIKWGLTLFHISFNIVNTGILIWFVSQIEALSIKLVPSQGNEDEQYNLEYISTTVVSTPEISIVEAQKEIAKYGQIVKRMNGFVKGLLLDQDNKSIAKTLARIKKYEDITDNIEAVVAKFLAKISQNEMSEGSSIKIRGMLSIIGDLERIGDIYYQMSKGIERKNEKKVYFTPEQRNSILEMFSLVEKALDTMTYNLNQSYSSVSIAKAKENEDAINKYRKMLRKEHFASVEKGEYNFNSAVIYSDLFNSLEKVGDHIINVTEGITGEI